MYLASLHALSWSQEAQSEAELWVTQQPTQRSFHVVLIRGQEGAGSKQFLSSTGALGRRAAVPRWPLVSRSTHEFFSAEHRRAKAVIQRCQEDP